jgi:hypothetical protein
LEIPNMNITSISLTGERLQPFAKIPLSIGCSAGRCGKLVGFSFVQTCAKRKG